MMTQFHFWVNYPFKKRCQLWWSSLYLIYIVNLSVKGVFSFGCCGTSSRVVEVVMCHICWHPTVGDLQNHPLFPTAWPVTQLLLAQFISVRTLLTSRHKAPRICMRSHYSHFSRESSPQWRSASAILARHAVVDKWVDVRKGERKDVFCAIRIEVCFKCCEMGEFEWLHIMCVAVKVKSYLSLRA